uniref:Uncharacterized protein n=4 Tax=Oryza TaxID=4527 RepID=A0A0D3GGQ7_9ORYZ
MWRGRWAVARQRMMRRGTIRSWKMTSAALIQQVPAAATPMAVAAVRGRGTSSPSDGWCSPRASLKLQLAPPTSISSIQQVPYIH